MKLRSFSIDRLPPNLRQRALKYIDEATKAEQDFIGTIDSLLREHARSELLEVEPNPEEEKRKEARLAELKKIESLHPGRWRAPRKSN